MIEIRQNHPTPRPESRSGSFDSSSFGRSSEHSVLQKVISAARTERVRKMLKHCALLCYCWVFSSTEFILLRSPVSLRSFSLSTEIEVKFPVEVERSQQICANQSAKSARSSFSFLLPRINQVLTSANRSITTTDPSKRLGSFVTTNINIWYLNTGSGRCNIVIRRVGTRSSFSFFSLVLKYGTRDIKRVLSGFPNEFRASSDENNRENSSLTLDRFR